MALTPRPRETKCDQCGKYFIYNSLDPAKNGFFLNRIGSELDPWRLCSHTCLVAKVEELR